VARAIVQEKTRIIDIDLRSYFVNVRHDRLLAKVARRVDDADLLHLLKLMLKANGQRGVPQGGVISPLLSNLYLHPTSTVPMGADSDPSAVVDAWGQGVGRRSGALIREPYRGGAEKLQRSNSAQRSLQRAMA
jgi:hypothetical protein